MDDHTQVRRSAAVVYQKLVGGAVLLHLDTGEYHGLDHVGERVWELLEVPCTRGDLVNRLAQDFEVDRSTLAADLEEFLESLSTRRLVESDNLS